mmetsp:Transcript_5915/g.20991  ORF Transcript_5915/g.20991 Transcript_5915/m.20991 type:complete len:206 (+) Transcript_5915:77-694(+)
MSDWRGHTDFCRIRLTAGGRAGGRAVVVGRVVLRRALRLEGRERATLRGGGVAGASRRGARARLRREHALADALADAAVFGGRAARGRIGAELGQVVVDRVDSSAARVARLRRGPRRGGNGELQGEPGLVLCRVDKVGEDGAVQNDQDVCLQRRVDVGQAGNVRRDARGVAPGQNRPRAVVVDQGPEDASDLPRLWGFGVADKVA